jgi:hypothetical protein
LTKSASAYHVCVFAREQRKAGFIEASVECFAGRFVFCGQPFAFCLSPSAGGLNGGVSLAGKLLDHIIRKRPVMTAKRLDVRPVLAVKTKLKAFTADETLIQLGYHFGPNASLGFSLHFLPLRLSVINS